MEHIRYITHYIWLSPYLLWTTSTLSTLNQPHLVRFGSSLPSPLWKMGPERGGTLVILYCARGVSGVVPRSINPQNTLNLVILVKPGLDTNDFVVNFAGQTYHFLSRFVLVRGPKLFTMHNETYHFNSIFLYY